MHISPRKHHYNQQQQQHLSYLRASTQAGDMDIMDLMDLMDRDHPLLSTMALDCIRGSVRDLL